MTICTHTPSIRMHSRFIYIHTVMPYAHRHNTDVLYKHTIPPHSPFTFAHTAAFSTQHIALWVYAYIHIKKQRRLIYALTPFLFKQNAAFDTQHNGTLKIRTQQRLIHTAMPSHFHTTPPYTHNTTNSNTHTTMPYTHNDDFYICTQCRLIHTQTTTFYTYTHTATP